MANSFCCLEDKDNRLSSDYGKRKSNTMISFLFLLGRKILCPSKVHIFC